MSPTVISLTRVSKSGSRSSPVRSFDVMPWWVSVALLVNSRSETTAPFC